MPNPNPNEYQWIISIYGGIFELDTVKKYLLDQLKLEDDPNDRPTGGKAATYTFSLTSEFMPDCETLGVSTALWAVNVLANEQKIPEYKNFQDMVEKARKYMANEVEKHHLTVELLEKINNLLLSISHSATLWTHGEFQGVATRKKIKSSSNDKEDTQGNDFLNSFHIEDLGHVYADLLNKKDTKLLSRYMAMEMTPNPPDRIDIRKNIEKVYEMLHPDRMPDACWPAKGKHPLVFSQQFSVNSIIERLDGSGGTYAVNGPPGTGKTTMLRDLIAHIVTKRAKILAGSSNPKEFFGKNQRTWENGKQDYGYYPLNSSLMGHEIVVASSNNGAVENVTKEIPDIDSIDAEHIKSIDFFKTFGTKLIGKDAWGSGAVPLGNSVNKNAFIQKVYFGYKEYDGFIKELDAIEKLPTKQLETAWHSARKNFLDAIEKVSNLKKPLLELLTQTKQTYEHIANLNAQIKDKEQKCTKLEIEVVNANQRFELCLKNTRLIEELLTTTENNNFNAQENVLKHEKLLNEYHGYLDNHNKRRLGLFGILRDFVTNKLRQYRSWHQKLIQLQNLAEKAEDNLRESKQLQRNMHAEVEKVMAQHKISMNASQQAQKEEKQFIEELIKQKTQLRIQYDELNTANQALEKLILIIHDMEKRTEDDAEREKSSPWMSEELQQARAQVFIEAMNLHTAFIRINAKQIKRNLWVFKDILENVAPRTMASKNIVKNVWATLFLCIPVVSTTFASFSRLFPHYWGEDIGWLLIDEAGQAQPQAAVGAIMRSKRCIAVGDPLQLEPIIGLPVSIQKILRQKMDALECSLAELSSVQTRLDHIESLGTYLDGPLDQQIWVGSPLRVHRRCQSPMFEISNQTTYGGMMVHAESGAFGPLPASQWIDVVSESSNGHWIEAEGVKTLELVEILLNQGIKPDQIYAISPFRDVVKGLGSILSRYRGLSYGTIHTVQGKEAEVVIFVLGTGTNSNGARAWAAAKPNLLNVSVTRSKKRLYIIGNKQAWSRQRLFAEASKILDIHNKIAQ